MKHKTEQTILLCCFCLMFSVQKWVQKEKAEDFRIFCFT